MEPITITAGVIALWALLKKKTPVSGVTTETKTTQAATTRKTRTASLFDGQEPPQDYTPLMKMGNQAASIFSSILGGGAEMSGMQQVISMPTTMIAGAGEVKNPYTMPLISALSLVSAPIAATFAFPIMALGEMIYGAFEDTNPLSKGAQLGVAFYTLEGVVLAQDLRSGAITGFKMTEKEIAQFALGLSFVPQETMEMITHGPSGSDQEIGIMGSAGFGGANPGYTAPEFTGRVGAVYPVTLWENLIAKTQAATYASYDDIGFSQGELMGTGQNPRAVYDMETFKDTLPDKTKLSIWGESPVDKSDEIIAQQVRDTFFKLLPRFKRERYWGDIIKEILQTESGKTYLQEVRQ